MENQDQVPVYNKVTFRVIGTTILLHDHSDTELKQNVEEEDFLNSNAKNCENS